ncbi:unnamed protein product [Pelagomonas calceolata]|uniref:Uncharacterized protein n=1 Tax=Pelagomonas calceolata TaxID=35677 RepID=A0A6S8QMM7_9STRA|nr:unnamed protein product [Pelagomonas calceolata]|mmetsp:Transcript_2154/g.6373  ORF Transcript_2154/g.6373 Transcript_2154/m.6373 type:complete len:267 (+) Transcript_2154:56-856(+)
MKLLLLLALHGGAHASTRHKATKNAVDEATTQRLAAEAASASVIKMPGAVAKLFGREEGAEVPAKQAQGPVKQHQDRFKAGSDAPGKVDIYYLGVAGPPADFVLVDTKSGAEHRIPIEAGTHITYDNSVYEHRVDAHPDSKRTLLGPASLPSGGRRLEAVGGAPQWFIDGYCPENIQCSTSADCEGLGPEEWNISPFNRKLVEQAEAGGRRLDDTPPPGPPILCIYGLEPLGFGEDPGNLRRNLRFGNSGGGNGCCFPFFPFGPIG